MCKGKVKVEDKGRAGRERIKDEKEEKGSGNGNGKVSQGVLEKGEIENDWRVILGACSESRFSNLAALEPACPWLKVQTKLTKTTPRPQWE